MCGIAGIIVKSDNHSIDIKKHIVQMNSVMSHRGPDDEGCFVSAQQRVGFGNRRLAIRDLSPAGHMPMCDEHQQVWITYNGEVYNADSLRKDLQVQGYQFKSATDTEVILKGYMQWGEAIVPKLRGQFAFAIYDERDDSQDAKILLARDHLGIKPLYYVETATHFLFGSELKIIIASGLISNEINPDGLMGYLLTGSVPNPLTIYRDIQALEPSHFISFHLNQHRIQPRSFWKLPTDTRNDVSYDQAIEETRNLLNEVVKMRLVSDVPLGAFLSGGLDSSAVVTLMRRATDGDIRTCSMVFDESQYSESTYARAVADKIGSVHYERVITASDVSNEFDNILNAMDQPSNDGVNTYFVSQTARQAGLTVALSGLGGDELYGGYANTFNQVPQIYTGLRLIQAIPMMSSFARALIHRSRQQKWRLMASILDATPSLSNAYWSRRGFFTLSEVHHLLHKDFADAQFESNPYVSKRANSQNHNKDSFAWISRAELRTYTHNQLLRDTDVMSMAHSLEVRVPFLDYKLVEHALRLPAGFKRGNAIKPLLLRTMKDQLPDIVTNRQDKQGFVFPMDIWLRSTLREKTDNIIEQVKTKKWLNPKAVDDVVNQYHAGHVHWSRMWALIALGSVI